MNKTKATFDKDRNRWKKRLPTGSSAQSKWAYGKTEAECLDDFETFVEMFGTDEIMARFESETEKWTGTGEVTKDQMIVNIATDFYSS